MSKKTAKAVMLTHDNLVAGEGLDLIEEYLNLKTALQIPDVPPDGGDEAPTEIIDVAQDTYERYLYQMKSMDHLSIL